MLSLQKPCAQLTNFIGSSQEVNHQCGFTHVGQNGVMEDHQDLFIHVAWQLQQRDEKLMRQSTVLMAQCHRCVQRTHFDWRKLFNLQRNIEARLRNQDYYDTLYLRKPSHILSKTRLCSCNELRFIQSHSGKHLSCEQKCECLITNILLTFSLAAFQSSCLAGKKIHHFNDLKNSIIAK